jgi:hypothetical protein
VLQDAADSSTALRLHVSWLAPSAWSLLRASAQRDKRYYAVCGREHVFSLSGRLLACIINMCVINKQCTRTQHMWHVLLVHCYMTLDLLVASNTNPGYSTRLVFERRQFSTLLRAVTSAYSTHEVQHDKCCCIRKHNTCTLP